MLGAAHLPCPIYNCCPCSPAGCVPHHQPAALLQAGKEERAEPCRTHGPHRRGAEPPLPAATALRRLSHRRGPAAPAPLWRLRQGVRRVLPGTGPVLRLGRHRLHPLRAQHQEVCRAGTPCPDTRAHRAAHASPQALPPAGRPQRGSQPAVLRRCVGLRGADGAPAAG